MLCIEGRVAAAAFAAAVVVAISHVHLYVSGNLYWTYSMIPSLFLIISTFFVPFSPIVKRAALLGVSFGVAVSLFAMSYQWRTFGLYFASLSFFHFSEYLLTAAFNPDSLSLDSFLINHSPEYQAAAVASWIEFVAELYFFPGLKVINLISISGLLLVTLGEILRKLAMVTAGSNFRHIVQTEKARDHALVTSGVYTVMRHPSYAGWFCWSLGTQILLCNPVCLIGYAIASWNFFYDRIREEEYYLLQFFGEDYVKYMAEVGTGIPFNTGLEKDVHAFLKSN